MCGGAPARGSSTSHRVMCGRRRKNWMRRRTSNLKWTFRPRVSALNLLLFSLKQVIIVAAIVVGVCAAYVLAHLALIEVGREVVVVHEPNPTGAIHKARL